MGLSAVIASSLAGCAVFAVADAAITVAATAVKVTAKTVGVAADIVLPSSDKAANEILEALKARRFVVEAPGKGWDLSKAGLGALS